MNKTELVGVVAEKTGMNRKDADKAINMVFESIVESLGNGEKVQVLGFGTFVSPIILGVQSPIYSTAVGLIHYVQQSHMMIPPQSSPTKAAGGLWNRIRLWFQNFFA